MSSMKSKQTTPWEDIRRMFPPKTTVTEAFLMTVEKCIKRGWMSYPNNLSQRDQQRLGKLYKMSRP